MSLLIRNVRIPDLGSALILAKVRGALLFGRSLPTEGGGFCITGGTLLFGGITPFVVSVTTQHSLACKNQKKSGKSNFRGKKGFKMGVNHCR